MTNKMSKRPRLLPLVSMMLLASAATVTTVQASSHREAPYITSQPKVDGTDFYMFNSYEAGSSDMVTLIANYLPLQDAYGGPNYFSLDPNALYEIHIDNDGDAVEDITFQFRFKNNLADLKVPVGDKMISIPLVNKGPVADPANLNVKEEFTVTVVRGPRRGPNSSRLPVTNATGGSSTFAKPVDNIGSKSTPMYAAYANNFIYTVNIPGCQAPGKVFVGQRKDSFAVNLGEIFDLINTNPLGTRVAETDDLADKNVTSLAIEVPKSCLTANMNQPIIGGWTTASVRQARLLNPTPQSNNTASKEGGAWTQVSRLGMPLVNEVVIGLKDKDKFNASQPKDDALQFADYVTNPSLPELIELIFTPAVAPAPNNFPRKDLIAAFLTGVPGVNKPAVVTGAEMLRLNTMTPANIGPQGTLGVLGGSVDEGIPGDPAGFPNGRRPGDDVVDVTLRVAMGKLCTVDGLNTDLECSAADAPAGAAPLTDGVAQNNMLLLSGFPYLGTPLAGSPNGTP